MLRILGSPLRLHSRWTRRELLRVGGLGLCGLGLADFFRLTETPAAPARESIISLNQVGSESCATLGS